MSNGNEIRKYAIETELLLKSVSPFHTKVGQEKKHKGLYNLLVSKISLEAELVCS